MMRGVQFAKRSVINFVEGALPAWLTRLNGEWGTTLEAPVLYLPNEPSALDRFPIVACSAVRTPTVQRREYEAETPWAIVYDTRYSLRLFCWVRQEGQDDAITHRDDLTVALRSLVIANPTFNVPSEAVLLDEATVTEEYSEVARVKGDRIVAGSYVGFDVTCVERIVDQPLGTVSTVNVREYPVPHPALE